LRDFVPAYVCEDSFGPLEVAYDLAAVRGRISRASIAAGPPIIWRYRELLPAPAGEQSPLTADQPIVCILTGMASRIRTLLRKA
jgi:threonine synthase